MKNFDSWSVSFLKLSLLQKVQEGDFLEENHPDYDINKNLTGSELFSAM